MNNNTIIAETFTENERPLFGLRTDHLKLSSELNEERAKTYLAELRAARFEEAAQTCLKLAEETISSYEQAMEAYSGIARKLIARVRQQGLENEIEKLENSLLRGEIERKHASRVNELNQQLTSWGNANRDALKLLGDQYRSQQSKVNAVDEDVLKAAAQLYQKMQDPEKAAILSAYLETHNIHKAAKRAKMSTGKASKLLNAIERDHDIEIIRRQWAQGEHAGNTYRHGKTGKLAKRDITHAPPMNLL